MKWRLRGHSEYSVGRGRGSALTGSRGGGLTDGLDEFVCEVGIGMMRRLC